MYHCNHFLVSRLETRRTTCFRCKSFSVFICKIFIKLFSYESNAPPLVTNDNPLEETEKLPNFSAQQQKPKISVKINFKVKKPDDEVDRYYSTWVCNQTFLVTILRSFILFQKIYGWLSRVIESIIPQILLSRSKIRSELQF